MLMEKKLPLWSEKYFSHSYKKLFLEFDSYWKTEKGKEASISVSQYSFLLLIEICIFIVLSKH